MSAPGKGFTKGFATDDNFRFIIEDCTDCQLQEILDFMRDGFRCFSLNYLAMLEYNGPETGEA